MGAKWIQLLLITTSLWLMEHHEALSHPAPVLSSTEDECRETTNRRLLSAEEVERKCDIPEFFTCAEFADRYWNQAPAVLRQPRSSIEFERFQHLSNKSELLRNQLKIRLSTSVSYTGKVFKEMAVSEYVQNETPASVLGNETFYLFGNHDGEGWNEFLSKYPRLEHSSYFSCLGLDPDDSALSFGVAKNGTGVPWHFHGPGFLQVLVGSKMWFLTPYEVSNREIGFDPNITTKGWYEDEYLQDEKLQELVMTCHLEEGDIIYFPPMWRHATYNTKWASWVSTFLK